MTENLPVKQEENRDQLGRFREGISGNPNGRPKGSIAKAVDEALEEVEITKGKSLLKHLVERAYTSDKVLIAIVNKLIPNAKPREIEDREPVEVTFKYEFRQEEQECLNEVFETWKANRNKPDNTG